MSSKKLDFIVIGAQKAGTTSLFRYLQLHPMIYMLPEKEAPFFNRDDYYQKGLEWYIKEFFTDAPEHKLWGKVTPGYMTDHRVPQRIYQEIPDVKLIVLLRNPIDRAFSHYKMAVRRSWENQSFKETIKRKLQASVLEYERSFPNKIDQKGYLVLGEYYRIIIKYLQVFPQEQVLFLFTENLAKEPHVTLKKIMNFLNVDDQFQPPNLHIKYHVGGTKTKIPIDTVDLQKNWLIRQIRKILPYKYRTVYWRRFLFWFKTSNIVADSTDVQMSIETRKLLAKFYQDDVRNLNSIIEAVIPWKEFHLLNRISSTKGVTNGNSYLISSNKSTKMGEDSLS